MMRASICLVCCLLLVPRFCFAEYREFKSSDGRVLKAELVSATETAITIRNERGTLFRDVPLEKFSAADHAFIRQWLKEQAQQRDQAEIHRDARIRLTFSKGKDDDFNEYGDIDDRVVSFSPAVIIESQEHEVTYTEVTGTIVVIGRGHLQRDLYAILNRQEFIMDIPYRETSRWQGKDFSCSYDPDYGGFEYGGYLVVLRDRSGKIVYSKASKTALERAAEAVLKAKKRTGYDSSFSRKKSMHTSFGLPD